MNKFRLFIIAALLLVTPTSLLCQTNPVACDLEKNFVNPPDSAKPWAFWVWFAGGGRWSKEGATADLEAMKRVGINGVIIMGNPATLSTEWREKFKYSVAEAARLGMEVTAYNGPGWAGSGGSWIGPEQATKKLVWTETTIEGPQRFESVLKQPEGFAWDPLEKDPKKKPVYYQDLAVLAFPTPAGTNSILNLKEKALFARGYCSGYGGGGLALIVPPGTFTSPEPGTAVQSDSQMDLTTRLDKTGRLTWDVPAGKWTVLRFGYCPTGALVQPTKEGLECDKMSKEALDVHFKSLMAQLIADVKPLAGEGKTLVATHIDSWEAGPGNWTPRFREEFKKRRGYDPLRFLPILTDRVLDNLEVSERFLWDFRQTISDLIVENYAGHMQTLAHQHGLRLSIEGYDGSPCDDMTYAARADVPMGEFWCDTYQTKYSCTEMASAAHVYGKKVVQAEAFTSENFGPTGGWYYHPAATKSLGDWALCEGINRFVFHNFTIQPDLDRKPGVIWFGVYHQRNQTWWELSGAYHRYLARCQFLLQQGLFVADICYLAPEASPQYFLSPQDRSKYNYDGCTAEVVLTRMSVKDGRLVLPDGMSYRLLVLPKLSTMTPRLLRKIKQLVEEGATVVGPRPLRSPSFQDYPRCDQELKSLADELWGNCDGKTVRERSVGKGRILWGDGDLPLYAATRVLCTPSYPSYTELYPSLSWLHACLSALGTPPDFESGSGFKCIHRQIGDTDLYFIANPDPVWREADCTFRVVGKQPELWDPVAGTAQRQALYREKDGLTTLPLRLGPSGSSFVAFRKPVSKTVPVVAVSKDGTNIVSNHSAPSPEWATMELQAGSGNNVDFLAWEPGRYELKAADGKTAVVEVKGVPALQLNGPWELSFPTNWGAPDRLMLDKLISWTDHNDAGVKYYSGTATYRKNIQVPPELLDKNRRLCLDLGNVQVMAQVKLNGQDLGILWNPPFRVDITAAVKPGENALEIVVANVWANRLIGDMLLPAEKRITQFNRKLDPNAPLAESGLLGPVRIVIGERAEVVFSR
jgi:hypothetical protein